jgi:hypothetical protein
MFSKIPNLWIRRRLFYQIYPLPLVGRLRYKYILKGMKLIKE